MDYCWRFEINLWITDIHNSAEKSPDYVNLEGSNVMASTSQLNVESAEKQKKTPERNKMIDLKYHHVGLYRVVGDEAERWRALGSSPQPQNSIFHSFNLHVYGKRFSTYIPPCRVNSAYFGIYQCSYSMVLITQFGWCTHQKRPFFIWVPVSSAFPCLAAPGSAPLPLRLAGLTSVASAEECDDCCLYHSDNTYTQTFCSTLTLGIIL